MLNCVYLSDSRECWSSQVESLLMVHWAVWWGEASSLPACENSNNNTTLCGTALPTTCELTISSGVRVIIVAIDFSSLKNNTDIHKISLNHLCACICTYTDVRVRQAVDKVLLGHSQEIGNRSAASAYLLLILVVVEKNGAQIILYILQQSHHTCETDYITIQLHYISITLQSTLELNKWSTTVCKLS